MAFYRPFYLSFAGIWTPGPTAYGTPASIYEEHTTDVMSLVRDRLEAGLSCLCVQLVQALQQLGVGVAAFDLLH